MTTSFDRTVGPKADVQELEYISALHQTAPQTRPTGTISSLDIQRFLKSRHCLEISHRQACDILRGLGAESRDEKIRESIAVHISQRIRSERVQKEAAAAAKRHNHVTRWKSFASEEKSSSKKKNGAKHEDDKAQRLVEEALTPTILYLDLVQTTSIILMPTLARMAQQWERRRENNNPVETESDLNPKPDDLLELVWHTMCNVIRSKSSRDNNINNSLLVGQMGNINGHQEDGFEAIHPSSMEEDSLRITPEMVQLLLKENGETERANDPKLIQEMVDMARGGEGNEFFDMAAFVRAIASDLQDWEVGCEDRVSTYVSDVCGDSTGNDNYSSLVEHLLSTGNNVEQSTKKEVSLEDIERGQRNDTVSANDGIKQPISPDIIIDGHEQDDQPVVDHQPTTKKNGYEELSQAENKHPGDSDNPKTNIFQDGDGDHDDNPNQMENRKFDKESDVDERETVKSSERLVDQSSDCDSAVETKGQQQPQPQPQPQSELSTSRGDDNDDDDQKRGILTEGQENDNKDENTEKASEHEPSSTHAHNEQDKLKGAQNQKRPGRELRASTLPPESVVITAGAKVIDTVVDAYASTYTLVLLWCVYVWYSATYASMLLSTDYFEGQCPNKNFGCTLGKTVSSWLILALLLSTFGLCALVPMSYGNHPTKRGPLRMFIAALLVAFVIFVPFTILWILRGQKTVFTDGVQAFVDSDQFNWAVYLTTALGCALILNYLLHCFVGLGRKWNLIEQPHILRPDEKHNLVSRFSTTSNVIGTARVKRAATRKVNLMLMNAREMHGPATVGGTGEATGGRASRKDKENNDSLVGIEAGDAVFQNFTLKGERTVSAGSLVWTWHRIFSGALFEEEGIWLPARLLIFQAGQVVVGIFISLGLFYTVEFAAEEADKAWRQLRWNIQFKDAYYPQWVLDLVPTGNEVRSALLPAACVGTAVCFIITAIYLPSTVRTVLKFRCGQLPSLGDKAFHDARAGADKAHMNTANAIFGMVAGCVLFFFVIGLLVFLFLWEFTKDFALLILAWGIGLTITIVAKTIVTSMCRKRFFRALYRTNPGRANLSTLALECWFIGLGGGVLVGRVTQFLLAAAFWVGRIDEAFLAPNVAIAGYHFDYVPLYYVTEILVHEAHRHPYLERMGAMYLMRLRHRTFGSDAGGAWRQLFVLTLMPWLMKYRVFHEQRCIESVHDQQSEEEVERDEDKDALASMAQELLGTGGQVVGAVDKGAKKVGDVGVGAIDVGVDMMSGRLPRGHHVARASF